MTHGTSLEAVKWLAYMQEMDDDLLDNRGIRRIIQHSYFRGEIMYAGYKVDGYANVDNNIIIYEYNGCRFNSGCPY